jgi:hypothetical protein
MRHVRTASTNAFWAATNLQGRAVMGVALLQLLSELRLFAFRSCQRNLHEHVQRLRGLARPHLRRLRWAYLRVLKHTHQWQP